VSGSVLEPGWKETAHAAQGGHLDQRGRRVNLAGICVTVGFDGRSEAWQAVSVPDLAEADPQDRVFALEPETGQVRFGDGAHGLRPPADSIVQVR